MGGSSLPFQRLLSPSLQRGGIIVNLWSVRVWLVTFFDAIFFFADLELRAFRFIFCGIWDMDLNGAGW